MAEAARRTSVANKGLVEQLLPEKSSAKAASSEGEGGDAGPLSRHERVGAWLARHPSRGVVLLLLGLSLIGNGLVVWHFRSRGEANPGATGGLEVDLGSFVCRNHQSAEGALQEARFALSVALSDDIAVAARESLEGHRRRVRQAVEELLRRANDDDFADPNLTGLKRRLREQINGVLGMRGIAEVVVTELVVDGPPRPAGNPEDATAFSSPPQGGSR